MSRHKDWIWFWEGDDDGAMWMVEEYLLKKKIESVVGVADEYQVAQLAEMRMLMRIIHKLRVIEGRMDSFGDVRDGEDDCPFDHSFVDEVKADVEKWAEGMKKKPE